MPRPTTPDLHVLGDWGTSRLRLWLSRGGEIAFWREGPGIGALDRPAEAVLRGLLADLAERPGRVTLCGMAGARSGLREAPYVECPADRSGWAQRALRFALDGIPLTIGAGAALPLGIARVDVMRGEETQVFGAIALDPALGQGRHRLLLPGTHSKWVTVDGGAIVDFTTFPTGELYALIGRSTLLSAGTGGDGADDGFASGVARATGGGALGALFEARAQQLRRGRSGAWAAGFVSGLLIGGEIAEMAANGPLPPRIPVIGDGRLATRYAAALGLFGVAAMPLDAEATTLAGLALLDGDGP